MKSAKAVAELGDVAGETLARVEDVAKWIESKRIHYCWGGGHGAKARPFDRALLRVLVADLRDAKGLDCSGVGALAARSLRLPRPWRFAL